MAYNSSDVSAGDDILASGHNFIRDDIIEIRDADANLAIDALKKIYLDGVGGGGDTFIYEGAGDSIYFNAGGSNIVQIITTGLSLEPLKKLFLDGGGDTYLVEDAATNVINIFCGGAPTLALGLGGSNLDIVMRATGKFYFDNGSDTYINEISANVLQVIVDSNEAAKFLTDGMSIAATKKLYLDGGTHTYLIESADDVLDTYVGGALQTRLTTNGLELTDAGGVPTDLYLGSPAGTFHKIVFNTSGNQLEFYQGANFNFKFQNGGTGLADTAWSTFSPDIKKDKIYKNKAVVTESDYLDWALVDAKKPVKPYKGIPAKKQMPHHIADNLFDTDKEVKEETEKYVKDTAKIAIGTARWCDWARTKIEDLENRINMMEDK